MTYYIQELGTIIELLSDKRVALFFLNLDILTKWEREPRVTFIPKQTMKRIWNTKYVLPFPIVSIPFLWEFLLHMLYFLFKVEDINMNLCFNFSGIVKGLSDSQCRSGGLLQSQQPNDGGKDSYQIVIFN